MIIVITGESRVDKQVFRSYQPSPPTPDGQYLQIMRDQERRQFSVESWPLWIPKDKQEGLLLTISHCTSWQSVHRAIARTLGASILTATQVASHNLRNLVISLRDSIAKHNELLHWGVKVVSMNIPADAPAHTGRNQFLEAARKCLNESNPATTRTYPAIPQAPSLEEATPKA